MEHLGTECCPPPSPHDRARWRGVTFHSIRSGPRCPPHRTWSTDMGTSRSMAEQTIRRFLIRAEKDADVSPDTSLFADGIGLDSLETAELSSMLEDDLGRDPFSEGIMAQNIGEILNFYSVDEQPAT